MKEVSKIQEDLVLPQQVNTDFTTPNAQESTCEVSKKYYGLNGEREAHGFEESSEQTLISKSQLRQQIIDTANLKRLHETITKAEEAHIFRDFLGLDPNQTKDLDESQQKDYEKEDNMNIRRSTRSAKVGKSATIALAPKQKQVLSDLAGRVAYALALFLYGIEEKDAFLQDSLPELDSSDEFATELIKRALRVLLCWRSSLVIGDPVEYLYSSIDEQGIRDVSLVQKPVRSFLSGKRTPGAEVTVISDLDHEHKTTHKLRPGDVAIMVEKKWFYFSRFKKEGGDELESESDDDDSGRPTSNSQSELLGICPPDTLRRVFLEFQRRQKRRHELLGSKSQLPTSDQKKLESSRKHYGDEETRTSHSSRSPSISWRSRGGQKSLTKTQRSNEKNYSLHSHEMSDRDSITAPVNDEIDRAANALDASSNDAEQPTKKVSQHNVSKQAKFSNEDSDGTTKFEAGEDFNWICVECREAECALTICSNEAQETNKDEDRSSLLIICDGECHRPFHIICAGLATVPTEDEPWLCRDCESKSHACCLCGEYGFVNRDVWCCDRKNCGLFYHERCLAIGGFLPQVDVKVSYVSSKETDEFSCDGDIYQNTVVDENDDDYNIVPHEACSGNQKILRFSCPAHHCWTCDDGNQFGAKRGKLFRCLYCPIAYHLTCIPPTAKFHELAVLCHDHAKSHKLPDLDLKSSYQAQVEAKVEVASYVKKRIKRGHCLKDWETDVEFILFFGSMDIKRAKERLQPFVLPVDFRDQVYSKPPIYGHVQSLQYTKGNCPKRLEPSGESCQCHVIKAEKREDRKCGPNCFNRISMQECVGNPNNRSGEKNKYWNCELGIDCGNRKLGRRQFARCKVRRELGKGFGLVTLDGVNKDEIVQEYVGDVIDTQEMRNRMKDWNKEHPNDPNFYIMSLSSGWYIDARERGGLSRFINHSCQPNCKCVPINVSGYLRIAIIAIQDIAPGEFLSYDYQFETKEGERFVCRCGSLNCRGSLKRSQNNIMDSMVGTFGEEIRKTKRQILSEAKTRAERDEKFMLDYLSRKRMRLNEVGLDVPGADHKAGAETVASGPQNKYRRDSQGLFLWRNVLVGASSWQSRFDRLRARHSSENRKNGEFNESIKLYTIERASIDTLSQIQRWNKNK